MQADLVLARRVRREREATLGAVLPGHHHLCHQRALSPPHGHRDTATESLPWAPGDTAQSRTAVTAPPVPPESTVTTPWGHCHHPMGTLTPQGTGLGAVLPGQHHLCTTGTVSLPCGHCHGHRDTATDTPWAQGHGHCHPTGTGTRPLPPHGNRGQGSESYCQDSTTWARQGQCHCHGDRDRITAMGTGTGSLPWGQGHCHPTATTEHGSEPYCRDITTWAPQETLSPPHRDRDRVTDTPQGQCSEPYQDSTTCATTGDSVTTPRGHGHGPWHHPNVPPETPPGTPPRARGIPKRPPHLSIGVLDLHVHAQAGRGGQEGLGLFVPQLCPVIPWHPTGTRGSDRDPHTGTLRPGGL